MKYKIGTLLSGSLRPNPYFMIVGYDEKTELYSMYFFKFKQILHGYPQQTLDNAKTNGDWHVLSEGG